MWTLKAFLAAALGGASTVVAADPSAAAIAVNEIAVELHQRLAKGDENLCLSPYSIQTAFAMTYAGADGATREEMAKVLHYPAGDSVHESFADLMKEVSASAEKTVPIAENGKKFGGPTDPIILRSANRIFGEETYKFKSPFLKVLDDSYHAPLDKADFVHNAPNETKRINEWVEEQTQKRIRDLIPPGILDKETRLVLVNALYFKAPWAEQFRVQATKPEPFYIHGGEPKPVPTMVRKEDFGYAKRDNYSAVTIPYIGHDVHFLVLVPDDPKGLAAVEKALTAKELSDCAKLESKEVILHLPKFKLESASIRLRKVFEGLGMKTAFDDPQGSANFERMAPRKPNDYLYISEALHKTFIALDETGTEAAAATAVVMARATAAPVERPKPIEVKVDRPFLFAIQHRPTGVCLFLGRVTDPR